MEHKLKHRDKSIIIVFSANFCPLGFRCLEQKTKFPMYKCHRLEAVVWYPVGGKVVLEKETDLDIDKNQSQLHAFGGHVGRPDFPCK